MLNNFKARSADVRSLAGAAVLGSAVALAVGGAYQLGGMARADVLHTHAARLAGVAKTGFSNKVLTSDASTQDAGALAIAARLDRTVAPSKLEAHRLASLETRLQRVRDAAAVEPAAPAPSLIPAVAIATPSVAAPFHLRGALDQTRDLDCLSQAVYYEARGETASGQAAVAQVVLNRVRHKAFPKTVCGVVYQHTGAGCQFSFACNGAAARRVENAAWRRARTVAAAALDGAVMAEVGDATHFHAGHGADISGGLLKVAQIGAHVFYRFAGHAGSPSMFRGAAQPSGESEAPRVFAGFSPIGDAGARKLLASTAAAVRHVVDGAAAPFQLPGAGVSNAVNVAALTQTPVASAVKPAQAPAMSAPKPDAAPKPDSSQT